MFRGSPASLSHAKQATPHLSSWHPQLHQVLVQRRLKRVCKLSSDTGSNWGTDSKSRTIREQNPSKTLRNVSVKMKFSDAKLRFVYRFKNRERLRTAPQIPPKIVIYDAARDITNQQHSFSIATVGRSSNPSGPTNVFRALYLPVIAITCSRLPDLAGF